MLNGTEDDYEINVLALAALELEGPAAEFTAGGIILLVDGESPVEVVTEYYTQVWRWWKRQKRPV